MGPRASHLALAAGVVAMLSGLALARLAVDVLLEEAKAQRLLAIAARTRGELWDQGWSGW